MRLHALFFVCVVASAGCDSNPAQPTCTYTLSATTVTVGPAGGAGSVTVTTGSQCNWTASSAVAWIMPAGGTSGTGPGTFSFTVAATSDTNTRTGTMTVGGQTFTVTQAGAKPCEYVVAPVELNECMWDTRATVTVTTDAGCGWTASPGASWLTISSGASGVGTGPISVTFGENYDAARQSVIEVRWPAPTAGQNVHVAQSGCWYYVGQNSFDIPKAGGDFSFIVYSSATDQVCGGRADDHCRWTAVSMASWITVSGSQNSGDGLVAFHVAANGSTGLRTGTIVVQSQTVTIRQAGV